MNRRKQYAERVEELGGPSGLLELVKKLPEEISETIEAFTDSTLKQILLNETITPREGLISALRTAYLMGSINSDIDQVYQRKGDA